MTGISDLTLSFLINACWQIAVVALVASVCAFVLRNAAARTRHSLWVASLLLSLALPFSSVLIFSAEVTAYTPDGPSDTGQAQEKLSPTSSAPKDVNISAPATAAGKQSSFTVDSFFQSRRQLLSMSPALLFTLAACYGFFILYRVIRLWRAWRRINTLRRSVFKQELSARMKSAIERCDQVLEPPAISIACSAMVQVPVTVGALKPLIILPESFHLEPSEEVLVSVLGHEIAHVARRDFALNLIYEFLLLPISFHPFAIYIKRQIERTRELACDEMVTERLLAPHAYARALVRVAGTLNLNERQALTLSIFDANILEERIMKLVRNNGRLSLRAGRVLSLATFSLLFLCSLGISTFSFELRAESTARATAVALSDEADPPREVDSAQPQTQTLAQERSSATRIEHEQALTSGNSQERAQAACEAGRQHALQAIPMLVSMLGDDTRIQPIQCWVSGRWSPALESFKHPSPGEQAAIALASMGKPAFEPLANALLESNPVVRRNAAWAIGELTNMPPGARAAAVPTLIELLGDSDEWVAMAAARSLGELRDKRAVQGLIATLAEGSAQVREMAAWALSELKDVRAVEALCKRLLEDSQAEVRRTAAWALGEIRSSNAVAALKQALNDPEPGVRAKAEWALAEIEDIDG